MATQTQAQQAASPKSPESRTTATTKSSRLPAPSLFVGPPSRNASQLSITRPANGGLSRNPSYLGAKPNRNPQQSQQAPPTFSFQRSSDNELGQKFKTIHSNLNEVELAAQSSTHVFGESHARALDDLRRAQVELARAWGRGSEAADGSHGGGGVALAGMAAGLGIGAGFEGEGSGPDIGERGSPADQGRRRAVSTASASTAASTALTGESDTTHPSRPSPHVNPDSPRFDQTRLEDATAEDVKRAGERRTANEAYFRKVEAAVHDVVTKLDGVAQAMRAVESETRSLWSSSETENTQDSRRPSAASPTAGRSPKE